MCPTVMKGDEGDGCVEGYWMEGNKGAGGESLQQSTVLILS